VRASGTSSERTAQARAELGATQVSPRTARWLVGAFAACLLAPPALELAHGLARGFEPLGQAPEDGPGEHRPPGWLRDLEARLAERGHLTRLVQPGLVALQARLGAFDEAVVPGRDGFWFYRPDLDHLLGPGFLSPAWLARRLREAPAWAPLPAPDPRPALAAFAAGLRARGIRLVLLPVPVKPMLHPEALGGAGPDAALANPSRADFLRFAAAHAEVLDLAPELRALRAAGRDAYLRTDTHWRPEAVERAAALLAARLERLAFQEPPLDGLELQAEERAQVGDVARMAWPPEVAADVPAERVRVRRVLLADGPLRPDPGGEVLVLGDSFANVYSQAALGWGDGAGLAEQLAHALRRPVDLLAQNAGGAAGARRALAAELAQGRDRLRGKRVVVWVFSERELGQGDWPVLPLAPGPGSSAPRFLPAAPVEVEARVRAVGWSPLPGRVPYGEHLTAVLLDELRGVEVPPGAECLAYAETLRAQAWTAAALWRPGDRVRVRLGPFDEGRLGALARSELAGLELEPHALVEPLGAAPAAGGGTGPGWPEGAALAVAAALGALVGLLGWRREVAA